MDDHSKSFEDFEIEIISEIVSEDMVKEDNIECCVCMEFHWGVKLPNCNHFICPKCYYKLYYGYVSDIFYTNNPIPIYPEKPIYPYVNISQNLEIYNNLIEDDIYMDWFINDNKDLYNCIKVKSEFVDNINNNLLQWFENNELIVKYENDLIQYELNYKKYSNEMDIYSVLLEEEKENNIKNRCPLCRL
jgi:uncharacterized UPF0160 family protein